MRPRGAVELRRAPADDGLGDDDRRAVGDAQRLLDRLADGVAVVAVDLLDVPAEGLEAALRVVGIREARLALDRDVVVVVEVDEIAEAEVAGERRRLLADPLLEIAVGADAVDVVLDRAEHLIAGEARGHHLRGERHADAVRQPLPQRAGGHFDAAGVAVLRMSGGARAPLPEVLQLVHRHVGIAGEVEQRVEQHRRVAGREHEAVAVLPVRIRRIVVEELGPDDERDVGHPHRRAGVPRLRFFDGVDREEANGVDAKLFELVLRPYLRFVALLGGFDRRGGTGGISHGSLLGDAKLKIEN